MSVAGSSAAIETVPFVRPFGICAADVAKLMSTPAFTPAGAFGP